MYLRSPLWAVAAAALLTGCSFTSIRAEREVSLTTGHVAGAPVHVESRNGGIEIVVAPGSTEVVVEATIRCAGDTVEEAERRVAASSVELTRDTSRTLYVRPVFEGGPRGNDGASFVITVPEANDVHAESSNGGIVIAGATGSLVARTSNARVRVTDHTGDVDVTTSNGRLELIEIRGSVSGRTSNGRIQVALAPDETGPVHLSTSNGSIRLTVGPAFGGTIALETSNGHLGLEDDVGMARSTDLGRRRGTIVLEADGAASELSTSNGSINVVTTMPAGRG